MIGSILVPLDGSAFGEHALPVALGIARRAGAPLHLAHVHQVVPPTTIAGVAVQDNLELAMRKEEMAYLEGVVRRLAEVEPVPVRAALLDGEVAGALENYARMTAADLVVLATHGRGALGRFWLGSVADELVRHLPMPVLLVRPREEAVELGAEPILKHILLPLDGTPLAEQIIEPALELGGLTGARYTLLRAVGPVLRTLYLPEGRGVEGMASGMLDDIQARQSELLTQARNYLEGVAVRLRSRTPHVGTRVIVEDQPAVGILREAEIMGADLIALATHGRRGLKRLILGSVADKVIRGANLPVLVHSPRQA
jgi:nucleotide-binding universal stress UspA family protein